MVTGFVSSSFFAIDTTFENGRTAVATTLPAQVRRSPYCSGILEGRIAGGGTLWSRKSKPSIRIAPYGITISGLNTCSGCSAKTGFRAFAKIYNA
jgi:hypothetical protein